MVIHHPYPMENGLERRVGNRGNNGRAALTSGHVYAHLQAGGSSALNRGHEHHRAIRRCRICEGRPRRFGGVQRGGGTWTATSSRTVQQWSVIQAALAGARLVAAVPAAWAPRRSLA